MISGGACDSTRLGPSRLGWNARDEWHDGQPLAPIPPLGLFIWAIEKGCATSKVNGLLNGLLNNGRLLGILPS